MVSYPVEQTGLMTLAEFVRLYETEGPFELIDGERVPVSPVLAGHGDKARRIHDAFAEHNRLHQTGLSYFELAYVLTYSSDWVKGSREPDIMFFRMERLSAYWKDNPDWEDKPFVIVPDLVVEVISRHDHYSEVEAKVDRYLEDGVELVLVVDPRQKTVTLRGRDLYKKLRIGETLIGMNVIPGFEMPIAAIFE